MRAKIRDTEIFFDIEGVGLQALEDRMVERPVCFCIHGGPGGDHSGMKVGLAPLTDRMQLVYWDHRGQGRSARTDPDTYHMDNYVEDMEALRQHLGLDRIVVLGISFGGMVALAYASRYPENVSHLIAVVTTPNGGYVQRALEIVEERGSEEQKAVVERGLSGNFKDDEDFKYFFDVMGPMYSRTWDAEKARKSRGRGIVSAEASNVWLTKFVQDYDVTDDLHRITAPTLVVGARHDWICAPEFSELIASKIPQADLRIFENSGHSVTADEQQGFLDVVRGFLPYNTGPRNGS
jgi:proline iminopeptidase